MILRNVDKGGDLYDIIGINDIPAGDIEQVVKYQVPDDERIIAKAGDVIGLAWNSPGPKHVVQGRVSDDDVKKLKFFSERSPNDLNVNDRINASGTFSNPIRAYSIQAIVSGIVTLTFIVIKFALSITFPYLSVTTSMYYYSPFWH